MSRADILAKVTDMLAVHEFEEVQTVNHGWVAACGCGWMSDFPGPDIDGDKAYRAHVAAVLTDALGDLDARSPSDELASNSSFTDELAAAWDEGKHSDHDPNCRVNGDLGECICANPYDRTEA